MTNYKSIFKKLCKNIQDNDNTVTFSLNYHPDIEDYTDDEGNDLFHSASANGREQIVRFLAPLASISIDKTNNNGWTPLMQASRNGHLSIVLFLLSRGADPNKSTSFGMNSMVLAVKSGNFQVVKALLNNGYDSGICESTISPEMMAVSMGRDDILRELVDYSKLKNSKKVGNLVNLENSQNLKNPQNLENPQNSADKNEYKYGLSPLMIAARENNFNTVRLLLNSSENVLKDLEQRDVSGRRAAENARSHGNVEMRNYLEKKAAKLMDRHQKNSSLNSSGNVDEFSTQGLINAIKEGNTVFALKMLNSENLTEKRLKQMCSSDGATPLMYACMTGQMEIVKLLISKNVDVNAQDYENGWTALMQATYYGHFEIGKHLILEAGADVLIPAKNNLTVFDMAMVINLTDTELFRLLADRAMNLGMKPEQIQVKKVELVEDVEIDPKTDKNNWFQRIGSKLTFKGSKIHDSGFLSQKSQKMAQNLQKTSKNSNFDRVMSQTLPPQNSSNTKPQNTNQYGRLIHALPSPNSNPYGATDWLEPIKPPARFRHAVDEQLLLTQRVKNELTANGINCSELSKKHRKIGTVKPGKFLKNNSKYGAAARRQTSESASSTLTPARSLSSLGSIHDVQSVLRKLKLTKYEHIFEEQEIDLEAFMTLDDADLNDIGVTQDISREKLVRVVRQLANYHKYNK